MEVISITSLYYVLQDRHHTPVELERRLREPERRPLKVVDLEVDLSLGQIAKATRNFSSQKIGEGRFGSVYKAQLADGQVVCIQRAKKVNLELKMWVFTKIVV